MIIIEASNIYLGGGYTLLEELIKNIEHSRIKSVVYVGYDVVYDKLVQHNLNYVEIKKTSAVKTFYRYLNTHNNTLFFCNLPPFRRAKNSILYMHNPYILSRKHSKMKYLIYNWIVKFFARNVDVFACQTNSMAKNITGIGYSPTLLPFYVKVQKQNIEKRYNFCYISTVSPHKNHLLLFDAVEILVKKNIKFNLVVTVRDCEVNSRIIDRIKSINRLAQKEVIINKGFVSRIEVENILNSSKTLIFPSLMETFGLPIAEALMCDLRILASDRSYVYDLMENPITFDPLNPSDIAEKMRLDIEGQYEKIEQSLIVEDKTTDIIKMLNK